ncbi:MAG: formate dehydrogenase subunit delta [Candidatus Methylopumilus sp.]|jgi:formate dehydrogenase subunit delta
MNIEQLITMANQIGAFFKSSPDAEQAKKDIAMHLKRFWALSMRLQLIEHTQAHQGQGLEPIVKDAILQHQALLA